MEPSDKFADTLFVWIESYMQRSMQGWRRFTKERGLSMSQIGTLFQINHKGICGVSDISEHLGVTSAAVSQLLDRLVQQKLILRTENPNDRRGKQIALTDFGRQIISESVQARQEWLNRMAGLMTPIEKEQVILALHILIDKTNQLKEDPEPDAQIIPCKE